jgi:phytoene dehydrogenase-like protein
VAAAGPVVIIGAGMGGLAAALHLAGHGVEVVVLERAVAPGGKMRQVAVDGHLLDAGPTVLTMPWVLETLLREAGTTLAEALPLRPAEILARHAWSGAERLDLFACPDRSEAAIAAFAGRREARRVPDLPRPGPPRLRDAGRPVHPWSPAHPSWVWSGASARAAWRPAARGGPFATCGRRSATTSAIRACASCSAATPPTAASSPFRPPPR